MQSNNRWDGSAGDLKEEGTDNSHKDTMKSCGDTSSDQKDERMKVAGNEQKGENGGKIEDNEKQSEEEKQQPKDKEGDAEGDKQQSMEELLIAKEKELSEYIDLLKRLQAEFDNYRKRTSQSVAQAYNDSLVDVVAAFLPVLDNLERAAQATEDYQKDEGSIREGIVKIYKQFKDVLESLGVTEIEAMGCQFDPQVHNAVMRQPKSEDNQENEIVEVFQKGYKYKDRVIL